MPTLKNFRKFAVATLHPEVMTITHYTKYLLLLLAFCFIPAIVANASDSNFTVVIDAGHGGKDTGAIENSVKEKDVNLGVALKLAKFLKDKDKKLKVVLTRDKDVFLTLRERADIANKAKADLFISIHTNSLDLKNPNRKSVEGASTYTLGLHKDKNNMEVARRENSVMAYETDYNAKYSGFDPNSDESYIIFEMAQKANMSQSVKFAEAVQKQLVSVAERKDRGVKQAGFWVLWATSMPSVLVELDFVTNPKVAEFISSDGGQKKLATAIGNATLAYFKNLETERANGKKLRKEGASSEVTSGNSGADVVLASAEHTSGKKTAAVSAQEHNRSNQGVAPARRRRSGKAREMSENREYEVAVISDERNYVVETADATAEQASATDGETEEQPAKVNPKNAQKKDKSKKEGKDKKESKRVVNGKTVRVSSTSSSSSSNSTVADNSAKSNKYTKIATGNTPEATTTNKRENKISSDSKGSKQLPQTKKRDKNNKSGSSGSGAVRLEKREVVYRIQILASEDHLKSNNPRFCGLNPINCTKVGNLYKYTYGESSDKAEIDRMLIAVKKKIPDAFIVSQTK